MNNLFLCSSKGRLKEMSQTFGEPIGPPSSLPTIYFLPGAATPDPYMKKQIISGSFSD